MRPYTKFALIFAALVIFFTAISLLAQNETDAGGQHSESVVSTTLQEVPTTTVVATTTTEVPATTAAPTTTPETTTSLPVVTAVPAPRLPLAPSCSAWSSLEDAQAWMNANASTHDTSNIDTNGDGVPCTRHFAPPPPPTTAAPVSPPPAPAPAPVPAPAPSGSVDSIIRAAAAEFGVSGNLLVAIARCESTLNPTAVNSSSGALGLFQHLPQYWGARAAGLGYAYADWANPTANARVSAKMVRNEGTRPWNASRHCWS